MPERKTISFRIRPAAVKALDALAQSLDRDRTYLLNQAVDHFLELNEYHVRLIERGVRAAHRGDFVPDAQIKKLFARMKRSR
jgi:predicted transcriptional regulator